MTLGERLKRANWILFGLGVLLAVIGCVVVGAASQGSRVDYGWLQFRWLILGVTACLLVMAVPYRRIVDYRYVFYGIGILLLMLVLVVGRGKSAARWIKLFGFQVQPSELMKVFMVITLAGLIRYRKEHREFRGLVQPFALTLFPVLLIMKQPDLGTALLLMPVLFAILYTSGARPKHLGVIALAGLVVGVGAWFTPGTLKEYQKDRVRTFLAQNSRDKTLLQGRGHHAYHSRMVVGTSSFSGVGTGEAAREQTRFLAERHSDFIFPVYATSFGFTGVSALLGLYALFVALILRTAMRVREPSGRLLAIGIATMFGAQALINLAMTVGLFPVVGMPLPFLSAGGSSLLSSFVALGLVLNVGADHPVEFGKVFD